VQYALRIASYRRAFINLLSLKIWEEEGLPSTKTWSSVHSPSTNLLFHVLCLHSAPCLTTCLLAGPDLKSWSWESPSGESKSWWVRTVEELNPARYFTRPMRGKRLGLLPARHTSQRMSSHLEKPFPDCFSLSRFSIDPSFRY
jgi:hypothetical protein